MEDKDDQLFVDDEERDWDGLRSGFFAGPDLWAAGGGNPTDHIVAADCMQPDLRLPFVRVMKDSNTATVKSEPSTDGCDEDGTTPAHVKSEPVDCKNGGSANKKSPRHRMREQWKVSPTKGEEPNCNNINSSAKMNGPTTNNDDDSLSNCTSSSSNSDSKSRKSGNNSNSKLQQQQNTTSNNNKKKSDENGLNDDDDDIKSKSVKSCESAVKIKTEDEHEDVIESLELRSGLSFR